MDFYGFRSELATDPSVSSYRHFPRKPTHYASNQRWQMDLTQVSTKKEKSNKRVLGVIDSGSRACLYLQAIPDKASITLFKTLLDIVEKYGKPKAIKTDNEAVFTSTLFRFGLWCLGIKHQRTQLCSPWQNGRIERLFGTFNRYANQIIIPEQHSQLALNQFRCWYNHVRPHQPLGGQTPAEVWSNKSANKQGDSVYVNLWEGVLTGFYLPPDG